MRTLSIVLGALTGLTLATGAARAQDENPTTPGAIPNPGTYQGSLQLQQQQDRQDQQFRQQQQPYTPAYPQPRYGAPAVPRALPPPPRKDAQAFGHESAQSQLAETLNGRGDYAGAVRIWRPLAAQGDVNAQYNMGVMYDEGHGVPKNAAQAATYYRLAARKGMAPAMVNLAAILMAHARGPADLVPAYTWLTIAASRDPGARASARYNMGLMARFMSPAQIAQAQAAAQGWRPR